MAKQRTKSIEDIYNQRDRIFNAIKERALNGTISNEIGINRLRRTSQAEDKYVRNIRNQKSYKRTIISKSTANKKGFFKRFVEDPLIVDKAGAYARKRQYARSTYMGLSKG